MTQLKILATAAALLVSRASTTVFAQSTQAPGFDQSQIYDSKPPPKPHDLQVASGLQPETDESPTTTRIGACSTSV